MLPAHHRLTRPADFTATVRQGRRIGRPRVVVHVHGPSTAPSTQQRPGPTVPGAAARDGSVRVGLVVSKSVGSAVDRHRVSRRLRHVAAPLVGSLPPGTSVVLRALPASSAATSAELAADVTSALVRLGVLARGVAGHQRRGPSGPR